MLYISHRLEEVKAIADVVTVLRDGRLVATRPAGELAARRHGPADGRARTAALYPDRARRADAAAGLRGRKLRVAGRRTKMSSFALRPGEIVGFSGLVGAGRTELFEALFGLREGRRRNPTSTAARSAGATRATRCAAGAVYLTEDRKGKGLLLEESSRPT